MKEMYMIIPLDGFPTFQKLFQEDLYKEKINLLSVEP